MNQFTVLLERLDAYLTDPESATWIWFVLTVANGFLAMLNLIWGASLWVVLLGAITMVWGWRGSLLMAARRDNQV